MSDEAHGIGADNAGGDAPDNANGDDAPKYVTPDQLSETVNKAITGHLKRFQSSLEGSLSKRDEALLSKLAETFKPKPDADEDDLDDPDGSDDKPSGKPDPNDPVEALKRRYERQRNEDRKRIERLEEERRKEREEIREQRLASSLSDALIANGVDAGRLKHAAAYLRSTGSVALSDDGDPVFKDEYGDPVPLKEGIAAWAKSEDAKLYLPPVGARGSGDKPRGGRSVAASDDPAQELKRRLAKSILRGG